VSQHLPWPEEHRDPAEAAPPTLQVLADHLSHDIETIRGAQILCGIPCYNSQATVAHVVRAIETGLRRYYPDIPSAIVILDSHSSDRTVEAGLSATTAHDQANLLIPRDAPMPARLVTRLEGTRGKGNALRPLFTLAWATGARACATFDSDIRSIQPAWVEHLLGPVLEYGWDHVTPMYVRHRHDGTITNSIAYPLTASLYGMRIRQPIGGDFGFSGRLASFWAEQDDVWTTEVARFGIDIWMTTSALAGGDFGVCQARLGSKIHDAKDPGRHLGPMFRQVVGTLFRLGGRYAHRWRRVDRIELPPVFGFPYTTGTDDVPVDCEGLIEKFARAVRDYDPVLRSALSPDTFAGVEAAAAADLRPALFDFPVQLWIDVVFDLMVAVNANEVDERDALDAMIGLYFARTASFVREAAADAQDEAEARIDSYPDLYLARKDVLRERWSAAIPAAAARRT
jgi:glycosyltransferase involved in cell wall biosynthesis